MAHIPLSRIEEPAQPLVFDWRRPLSTAPLLRLGFRPFYLLAALLALCSVPLWLAAYLGGWVASAQITVLWHMHEMSFGFMAAVVIGFMFTAARNWTALWTPRRGHLAALVLLWLAGRCAMLHASPLLAAAIDIWFLPACAVPLYRVMKKSGNRRNLPLVGLLALLALANAAFHAAMLGWMAISPMTAVQAAILILSMLSTVMGGRVLPGFTSNMASGSKPHLNEQLDKAGIALVATASLAWIVQAVVGALASTAGGGTTPAAGALFSGLSTTTGSSMIAAGLTIAAGLLALAAGAIHLWRWSGWAPLKTGPYPLLWILHAAYAWIGAGYILLGAATLGYGSTSTAMHALAVGGMSSLILGMITRTALGHTARPVRAGKAEALAFAAIQLGALARLAANLMPAESRNALLIASGICWTLAFAIYLLVYGPYLMRPRLDGKDG